MGRDCEGVGKGKEVNISKTAKRVSPLTATLTFLPRAMRRMYTPRPTHRDSGGGGGGGDESLKMIAESP